MLYTDAAHHSEEAMTGSKQSKGKGLGKDDNKGKGKGGKSSKGDGAKAVEPIVELTVEQAAEAQMAQATAKNLQFSGISPAPQVEKLKPYPQPIAKPQDASMGNPAEDKVQQLEAALEKATQEGHAASILTLYKKETAVAKTETAKAAKETKEISFEALQKRVSNAQSAAAAALERHQVHVKALDEQVAQIQKIRENRVLDFAASQEAFATRLREDEKDLAQRAAAVAPKAAPQPAAAINAGVHDALADLQREYQGDIRAEVPKHLPDTNEDAKVSAMASLWHYYSAAGEFSSIPAITFDTLQVSPAFAHTLVGDLIWEGYWGTTHNQIQGSQYIPATMHFVLKYVLQEKHQELSVIATAKETARVRVEAARAAATMRRTGVDPF